MDLKPLSLRLTLVAALLFAAMPFQSKAYPVDCAILLCLAGGWPASAECAHARVVFIRRITPWPIEPPLQIWRCPMGISHKATPLKPTERYRTARDKGSVSFGGVILAQLESGADIDISGPEFAFIRSIRVWDVRHYSHHMRGRHDDCSERSEMRLGTYNEKGEFSWRRTWPSAAPHWVLPSRACKYWNSRRGVGVEWTDSEGNHGFEWVGY